MEVVAVYLSKGKKEPHFRIDAGTDSVYRYRTVPLAALSSVGAFYTIPSA